MTREEYIRDTAQKLFLREMEYDSSAKKVAEWAAKMATTLADEVFPEQEEVIIEKPVIIGEPVFPHSYSAEELANPTSLAEAEKEKILTTLTACYGRRRNAARILGISERTLYRKLKEYGV